jgi:hypothetical protein
MQALTPGQTPAGGRKQPVVAGGRLENPVRKAII